MTSPRLWTRRRFLRHTTAAAVLAPRWPHLLAAVSTPAEGASPAPPVPRGSAGVFLSSPHRRPLLEGATARARRYAPEGEAFVIRNGREFFNRPLYPATASGFRVDAGDLPELSLFLPGHGGNLRLGICRPQGAAWLHEFPEITSRYRAGRMLYQLRHRDLLGRGGLELEVAAASPGPGMHAVVRPGGLPEDCLLIWVFGGGSGRRGRHNGDLGCELVPVSQFFQLDPQSCASNSYRLRASIATLSSPAGRLRLTFPPGAKLHLASANDWNAGWPALSRPAPDEEKLPVLAGSLALGADGADLHLAIDCLAANAPEGPNDAGDPLDPAARPPALSPELAARAAELDRCAGAVRVHTPDPYLNATLPALCVAAEACWDTDQGAMLTSAVADRAPRPGWRGPWALDALGRHDRMQSNLRFWIARQNQVAVPADLRPDETVRGNPDPGTGLVRKDALLHSNGDLADGPSDMNLAFFDGLVRHLRWTGDAAFAREVWPAFLRHMDWQYRLFRRLYPDPAASSGQPRRALPLYESYGSIPAGQDLPYNGAGVAHASADNYFLNRAAASLARLLNEDPSPFDEEAELIRAAMLALLWMPGEGTLGEARDLAYPHTVFVSPGLWTLAHAMDSGLLTPRQAWQVAQERLCRLRRVPVHGADLPEGGFLLSSSEWFSEHGGRNQLSLAENMHAALALWQTGRADEAYGLLQGNLLDSLYRGLCPGNFHVTSTLDPHSGERGCDKADAVGITSRAIVEGLFGVLPDMTRGTLTVRPGFPSTWNAASLTHPDFDLAWQRDGLRESLVITSRLPQPVALTLLLPARTTSDPVVLSNGHAFPFAFDPDATGAPQLVLTNFPAATAWQVEIEWRGRAPIPPPAAVSCRVGEPVPLPREISPDRIDDPQGCLSNGVAARPGHHAVFAHVVEENCGYWLPIALEIAPAQPAASAAAPPIAETYEPVDLTAALQHNLPDLLTRSYRSPRSPFCSLSLPEHLIETPGGERFVIDDAGLRGARGMLETAFDIPFRTPADRAKPNARFLSHWQGDQQALELPLSGRAHTLYLLLTGTTFPLASHTEHGAVTVRYADGTQSRLALRSPETWWPVEQDLFLDDYLYRFPAGHTLPPRVDLRTGKTRLLELATFKGQGGPVPGGAATVLHLPLHADRMLASVRIDCALYGVVLAVLGMTLGR